MATSYLLNGIIAVRIVHAVAHLLFPFDVLRYTKEGLPQCDEKQLKDSSCLFATSMYAQSAVYELAWCTLFFYWRSDASIKSILFAAISVLLAVVEAWTAQGADIDIGKSAEVSFAQYLALSSVLVAAMSSTGSKARTAPDDNSLLAQANGVWFFICCFTRFVVAFNAASDPLESSRIALVAAWETDQQFILARMIALGGAHAIALTIALLFTPFEDRAGLASYMLLCTTQVFGYMIDQSILTRMPESLAFQNVIAGHAFFIVMYGLGLFLLFISWRASGYTISSAPSAGAPSKQEGKKQQ